MRPSARPSGRTDLDALTLVLTRATARHIRELIVAGRTVVRDGKVMGIDYPAARAEALARTRAGIAANAGFARALPHLERALAAHYEAEYPCC